MASNAPADAQVNLPVLYQDLVPLSSELHADWRLRSTDALTALHRVHAVPLLAEEFVAAQRFYPIVFSSGPEPVPLALMGLADGINVFVDEEGRFPPDYYVPAYLRRYPFLLARLRPESEDLSLCVDPASGLCGPFEEGEPVFEGGQPSERIRAILDFAEKFEQATTLTSAFVRDLSDHKLIGDGEFTVQPDGASQPYVYRGFQMVTEEAVKGLRGDIARKLIGNGALPLVYAHIFSLQRMGELFARQAARSEQPPIG